MSAVHVAVWVTLLLYFTISGAISFAIAVSFLVCGVGALAIFHARAYQITCAQDWVTARKLGRLWHVLGTAFPFALVLFVRGYI